MKNKYFQEEDIKYDDLFFVCYMIERVARKLHQPNSYIVNKIGYDNLYHLISVAQTLHCLNPLQVESDWINDYNLQFGQFDITNVDTELCQNIPTEIQMGKVYARLISSVNEDYLQGIFEVYNSDISKIIDDYNSSAYYEPSYILTKAYYDGHF